MFPCRGDPSTLSGVNSLAERLGHSSDDRLVIISAENLGCAHATNIGAYEALRDGLATSAALMVPCPWAREAVSGYRGEDVGVNLTLNSPFECYRWSPITHAPSLLDGDGGFPRTVLDLWDHADTTEVLREGRAQVERAILWGFDVNHLSTYLDAHQGRPEFFDVYLELAVEMGLPIRLADESAERATGFPFRKLAGEEGVLMPDRVIRLRSDTPRQSFRDTIIGLAPGVTEIVVAPAIDTPEIRALDDNWECRVKEYETLVNDAGVKAEVESSGAVRIGYSKLRDAQRAG
jgi:predicted glycoside hydrolase/deacetylase ChbG (UPF0249 family)